MPFLLLISLIFTAAAKAQTCQFRSHSELGRAAMNILGNLNCNNKKIHLTFDDGPHSQHTPLLLQELNRRNVKATFFISTTNITPNRTAQRNIVRNIMDSGHLIASHGHRHESYDLRFNAQGKPASQPLTEAERVSEIQTSVRYLNEATNGRFSRQQPLLFRFPYGRGALPSDAELDEMERRGTIRFSASDRATRLREYRAMSPALHAIAEEGFGHLLWNHDSGDSSSSAPDSTLQSKAQFVARNVQGLCRSSQQEIVSLFHDIKSFNPEVIAAVIDIGECLGARFVPATQVLNSQTLRNQATYIPRDSIQSAPLRQFNSIEDILRGIEDCEEENLAEDPSACYSQSLNRYFKDCEAGSVSICIRGKWYQKTPEKEQECRSRGL